MTHLEEYQPIAPGGSTGGYSGQEFTSESLNFSTAKSVNIILCRITASLGSLFGCVDVHVTNNLGDGSVRADIILNCIDRNYEQSEDGSRQTG